MFLSNEQSKIKDGLIIVLLIVGLSVLTGCQKQNQESRQPEFTPGFLTITGNGVEQPTRFSLTELKNLEEAPVGECYSIVNNWPAKKLVVGKGAKIAYLLEKAGIKNDAESIIVWAADGYRAAFTREQLEGKRFYFPNLLKGSGPEAQQVPAILAWEHREGTNDLSKASSGKLRLLLGQKGLNDVTAPVCVKDVVTLEVLSVPPGEWSMVQAQPTPGKVKPGTKIVLNHPNQDQVKIYYTMDGSVPDKTSCVYNPSTTYYQPDLTKPIEVNKSVIIKTIAIGFGKNNSPAATFSYDVE